MHIYESTEFHDYRLMIVQPKPRDNNSQKAWRSLLRTNADTILRFLYLCLYKRSFLCIYTSNFQPHAGTQVPFSILPGSSSHHILVFVVPHLSLLHVFRTFEEPSISFLNAARSSSTSPLSKAANCTTTTQTTDDTSFGPQPCYRHISYPIEKTVHPDWKHIRDSMYDDLLLSRACLPSIASVGNTCPTHTLVTGTFAIFLKSPLMRGRRCRAHSRHPTLLPKPSLQP